MWLNVNQIGVRHHKTNYSYFSLNDDFSNLSAILDFIRETYSDYERVYILFSTNREEKTVEHSFGVVERIVIHPEIRGLSFNLNLEQSNEEIISQIEDSLI